MKTDLINLERYKIKIEGEWDKYVIPISNDVEMVVLVKTEWDLEYVAVSPLEEDRYPTYPELREVRDMFWYTGDDVSIRVYPLKMAFTLPENSITMYKVDYGPSEP